MNQLTLFDLMPKQLSLGYMADDEVAAYKGEPIPFKDLANRIEERVIEEMPREGAIDYRVVLVKKYLTDCDKVYMWKDGKAEVAGTCDRVSLSDDNRRGKANMWLSEMHCADSQHCTSRHPTRFFKIKENQ